MSRKRFAHRFIGRYCRIAVRSSGMFEQLAGNCVAFEPFAPKPDAPLDLRVVVLRADAIDPAVPQQPQVLKDFFDMRVREQANRWDILLAEIQVQQSALAGTK